MKRISLVALTTFAAVCSAQADLSDPLRVIYRVAGVIDNGTMATVLLCSNFGVSSEKLRFTIKTELGATAEEINVPARKTVVAATTDTTVFSENLILDPGAVDLGAAIIHATSTQKIFCTALLQGKTDTGLEGVGLHMVRFNPATGVQEDGKGSPMPVIYRVPGVMNDTDVATMFQCTNFGTASSEAVKFVVHTPGGIASTTTLIAPGETARALTGSTDNYSVDVFIDTGIVLRAGATISATSTEDVFCSAALVNKEDPEGIALHMARVNAAAGTLE